MGIDFSRHLGSSDDERTANDGESSDSQEGSSPSSHQLTLDLESIDLEDTTSDEAKKVEYAKRKGEYDKINPQDVWVQVDKKVPKTTPSPRKRNNDDGWKTVRIFVSSTFRDFHNERNILVSEVFPKLRAWCESENRRLHLVECDLRWGVPRDMLRKEKIEMCLAEIERCKEHKDDMPLFINMIGERIGWVPTSDELAQQGDILEKYELVYGLSLIEMEILHAAYRLNNPNALFAIRDSSFMEKILKSPAGRVSGSSPERQRFQDVYREAFVDEFKDFADQKLRVLKEKLDQKFSRRKQIFKYKCEALMKLSPDGQPQLKVDKSFGDKVFEFFKGRLQEMYPETKNEKTDDHELANRRHKLFMLDRSKLLIGRDDVLDQITSYIEGKAQGARLLIGKAGAGKTSIMAKAVELTESKYKESNDKLVFYHFVGAVPESSDVFSMLCRILHFFSPGSDMPYSLKDALEKTREFLSTRNAKREVVIFIDGIDQLDVTREEMTPVSWLPKELSPEIRCILSMIDGSECHQHLYSNYRDLDEWKVNKLDDKTKQAIVNNFFDAYGKKVDDKLMNILTEKKKMSSNPLWLIVACEELRVCGDFERLEVKFESLPDSLEELLEQVLIRMTTEKDYGHLIQATLCLIEVSCHGLLESELLELLADEQNLIRTTCRSCRSGSKAHNTHEHAHRSYRQCGRLPSLRWANVFNQLRRFLRPFGDPAEGRLDFYHQSLSKAVKNVFLRNSRSRSTGAKVGHRYKWWHRKLADYFRHSQDYERKVKEYPYHLIHLRRNRQLEKFLVDWRAFQLMFKPDHSTELLYCWRVLSGGSGYGKMCEMYKQALEKLKKSSKNKWDTALKYENVSRLLIQAGFHEEAEELALESLAMFKRLGSSGADNEQLIYSYGNLAHLELQKIPSKQDVSQIPLVKEVLRLHQLAIDMIHGLMEDPLRRRDRQLQHYLGVQYTKKAFAVQMLVSRIKLKDPNDTSCEQSHRAAIEELTKAKAIFEKQNDTMWLVECYLSEAALQRGHHDDQLKTYSTAIELSRLAFGLVHHSTLRLYFNKGIVYEDQAREATDDEEKKELCEAAYHHFKMAYVLSREFNGEKHSRTEYFLDSLKEETYQELFSEDVVKLSVEDAEKAVRDLPDIKKK